MANNSINLPVRSDALESLRALSESNLIQKIEGVDDSLCAAWPEDRVKFEATNDEPAAAAVVFLDLGNRRLHRGMPFDDIEEVFGRLCSSLRTINLGGTDLPVDHMCRVLKAAPGLECVYLGGNGLLDAGLRTVASEALSNMERLSKLDLRYNDIGEEGIEGLCRVFSSSSPSPILYLYLEGNKLGDGGASAISRWMKDETHCQLQELYLGANLIGTEGASQLAACVPNTSSKLAKLYLEGNQIGPAGADAFSEALEGRAGTATLRHLYVDNNGIGKPSMQRLARALNSATTIGDPLELDDGHGDVYGGASSGDVVGQ